ncbi:TetR/AcrR family transcriptional regulator [Nonomuraea cavernae]|uniref:TetR family transcriptional regulator n=1 Tax=Nonomuraea cavernae TaxID=2045107 RepID=A0A917YQB2_9ACTN|nr:TetR/AcrR family transcriptional regulator [Nonomuraea cavernae]MCA2183744.1 TetR/AcrR family transcriptional regulator [Nonomuraea cavernae]GGO61234.1 TetR family transcriptional regulator [Nonomuraea cavernae]
MNGELVLMHAKPTAGRRERNRDAMRARVYEAAVSLFAEKGFTATSFDDIAARADVARATVFNHFRRKDEFLLAWGDERRRRLGALLIQESTREVGVVNQLTRCMRALSDVTTQERALTSELLLAWVRTGAPVLEEPYSAYVFAQIVTDGKARGEVRPEVDPVMAGQLIRDMYLGTLYRWVGGAAEAPFPLADAMTGALRLIFDGILTRPETGSAP